MKQLIIFAILLMVASAQPDENQCLNQVNCTESDVCQETRCPRFLNSDCRVNNCSGTCSADFFFKGANVTHRCPVQTCSEKVCKRNRECIEEVRPDACPVNNPKCRQYIRAKCVPPSRPPTIKDCSQLSCEQGMVCHVDQGGRRAKCVPGDCNQVTCGEGMFCRERRGGGVGCVRAKHCSQLDCESTPGLVCEQKDDSVRCVHSATTPIVTSATTPTMMSTFHISTVPITTVPITEQPDTSTCTYLHPYCNRFGFLCESQNGFFETCTTPEECVPVIADYCQRFGLLCEEVNGTAECVYAKSCNDIKCPFATNCSESGSFDIAFCTPETTAKTCDELNCEFIFGHVCQQGTDSAECVVGCSQDIIAQCNLGNGYCEVVNGVPECILPSSCDEVTCADGLRCITVESGNQTVTSCVPDFFRRTCEELTNCPPSFPECLQTSVPTHNVSYAQCASSEIVQSLVDLLDFQQDRCSNTLCNQKDQACIEFVSGNNFISSYCSSVNCTEGSCTSPDVCRSVPASSPLAKASSTVCAPPDFEFDNDGCNRHGREQCDNHTFCQDVEYQGEVLGGYCGLPFLTAPTCSELNCDSLVPDIPLGCIETSVFGHRNFAYCVSLETVDETVGLFEQFKVVYNL